LNDYTICEVDVLYSPKVRPSQLPIVSSSREAYDHALDYCKDIEYIEGFHVMLFNRSNRLLGIRKIATGGIHTVLVDIRLIFSIALKGLATHIICFHNHPSGNITPSDADQQITRKIKEAGTILEIKLTDHLIITADRFYSFADEGYI
jgi:DNA repair protein RadC